jgi:hypothetical protein
VKLTPRWVGGTSPWAVPVWGSAERTSDMGLDIWVARSDRNRQFQGQALGDLPRSRQGLPLQCDDATNRTVELIDVLWRRGNAIVAAFEVEHTSSIESGLLRMADLISMQPNLKIQLHIVAPDEKRDKVVEEITRPTFSQLSQALFLFLSMRLPSAQKLQVVSEVLHLLSTEFTVVTLKRHPLEVTRDSPFRMVPPAFRQPDSPVSTRS